MVNVSSTYLNHTEVLQKDPTPKFKRELTEMIRRGQREDPISTPLKHLIYPTSEETPKIYGLPKIHKPNVPLRPIVGSQGSLEYNASSVLTDILGGQIRTPHQEQWGFCGQDQESRGAAGTETDIIRCCSTVHQHSGTRCHQSSPYQIGRGP